MIEFPTDTESNFEYPGRREVFVMGYDPNKPGVLQAWDTESDSEPEWDVCMVARATWAITTLVSWEPKASLRP